MMMLHRSYMTSAWKKCFRYALLSKTAWLKKNVFDRLFFQKPLGCKKTYGPDQLDFLHSSGKIQRIHRKHPNKSIRLRSQNCPSAGLDQFYSILSNRWLKKKVAFASKILTADLPPYTGFWILPNSILQDWILKISIFKTFHNLFSKLYTILTQQYGSQIWRS